MIVYCCPDLLFATKIRSTAQALAIASRPARDAAMLQARLDCVDDGKGCEPVKAVIVDLAMEDVGLDLIEQTKKHSPSLLVVAYGSHVETSLLQSASDRGADVVLTRGQFTRQLPDLLQQLAQTK